jgi:hypothetical protein
MTGVGHNLEVLNFCLKVRYVLWIQLVEKRNTFGSNIEKYFIQHPQACSLNIRLGIS